MAKKKKKCTYFVEYYLSCEELCITRCIRYFDDYFNFMHYIYSLLNNSDCLITRVYKD